MCTYLFAKKELTLHLVRGEGCERYFGCNLMQHNVLASSHQHLMAEAPELLNKHLPSRRIVDSRNRALFPIKGKQVSLKSLSKLTIPGKATPCCPIWASKPSTALVTEDQEYDVIALPEQRRWQPVPRD